MSLRDAFLATLERSTLLSSAQFEQVRDLASQYPDWPARPLSQWIVDQGWLTLWQAEQVLAGNYAFLLDNYKLLDLLGQGGMGFVFKAQHVLMGRLVAIKVLSKARLANPSALARFRREVKAVARLNHPNIIASHDAGQVEDTHYLVMEYAPGRDLSTLTRDIGALPIEWACEFIRQAALGLSHAYEQGLVHRDIKPANLLVTWSDRGHLPVVKILDLGLARSQVEEPKPGNNDDSLIISVQDSVDAGVTLFGQIVGTPDFLSPEQIRGEAVDIRSDLFSLGCTLFKVLTTQLPFGGRSVVEKLQARIGKKAPPAIHLRTLRPDAPPELEAVLAKMLEREPKHRYQTPEEVVQALTPFAAGPRHAAARTASHNAVSPTAAAPSAASLNAAEWQSLKGGGTAPRPGSSVMRALGPEVVPSSPPGVPSPGGVPSVAAGPATAIPVPPGAVVATGPVLPAVPLGQPAATFTRGPSGDPALPLPSVAAPSVLEAALTPVEVRMVAPEVSMETQEFMRLLASQGGRSGEMPPIAGLPTTALGGSLSPGSNTPTGTNTPPLFQAGGDLDVLTSTAPGADPLLNNWPDQVDGHNAQPTLVISPGGVDSTIRQAAGTAPAPPAHPIPPALPIPASASLSMTAPLPTTTPLPMTTLGPTLPGPPPLAIQPSGSLPHSAVPVLPRPHVPPRPPDFPAAHPIAGPPPVQAPPHLAYPVPPKPQPPAPQPPAPQPQPPPLKPEQFPQPQPNALPLSVRGGPWIPPGERQPSARRTSPNFLQPGSAAKRNYRRKRNSDWIIPWLVVGAILICGLAVLAWILTQ